MKLTRRNFFKYSCIGLLGSVLGLISGYPKIRSKAKSESDEDEFQRYMDQFEEPAFAQSQYYKDMMAENYPEYPPQLDKIKLFKI